MESAYFNLENGSIYPYSMVTVNTENGDYLVGSYSVDRSSMIRFLRNKRIYCNRQTNEVIPSESVVLNRGHPPDNVETHYILPVASSEVVYHVTIDNQRLVLPSHWITRERDNYKILDLKGAEYYHIIPKSQVRKQIRPARYLVNGNFRFPSNLVVEIRSPVETPLQYFITEYPGVGPDIMSGPSTYKWELVKFDDRTLYKVRAGLGYRVYQPSQVINLSGGKLIARVFYENDQVDVSFPPRESFRSLMMSATPILSNLRPLSHKYCPDLYNVKLSPTPGKFACYMKVYNKSFPGYNFDSISDIERFNTQYTFFHAVEAPDDWEDLYGEPFKTRDCVYAFVKPGDHETMQFFSSEELISGFLKDDEFINPRTRERFTKEQIYRLEILAKEKNPVLTGVIRELRISQHDAINAMKTLSEKPGFESLLAKVLNVSMLMRGWSGEAAYPLQSSESNSPVDQLKLSKALLELQETAEPFKELRLIKQIESKWNFSDKTLSEQLKIVINREGVSACIRMTSGHFARTAWFYSEIFFRKRLFDIDQLESVV